jgi:hypothetical protein
MLDAGWQTFEALALRKSWADSGKIVLLSLRERLSELGTANHLAERDEYFKLTHYPGCWMLDGKHSKLWRCGKSGQFSEK